MTLRISESGRFVLPTRIRSKLGPDAGHAARTRLADQISKLPGVYTFEDSLEASPSIVGVYLAHSSRTSRKHQPAVLFCKIRCDGICVEGLNDAARHQVLSRGWGKLENRSIQLFLPRDDDEFEVCWHILYRAYRTITNPPATFMSAANARLTELPEFSRTTLC
jgi:hypothetical protein